MISPNIIIMYDGTHASIPSGFTRETSLDGKFPKGTANATNPNTTGGATTHTHTSSNHTHSINGHSHAVQTTSDKHETYASTGSGQVHSELWNGTHYHNATVSTLSGSSVTAVGVTYSSFSNDPPYYTVIFIKSTSYSFIPTNGMVLSASTSRSGFSFHSASANRFLKGASTSANAGSTGGTTTNTHTITHSHSTSHGHTGYTGTPSSGGGPYNSDGSDTPKGQGMAHGHSVTLYAQSITSGNNSSIGNQTETVQPAYRTLNAFKNTGSAKLPLKNDIAMWLGTLATIPLGWKLCDGTNGTPDMRSRFLKIPSSASSTSTGGSNTHTHASQSHTHTLDSHSHTGYLPAGGDYHNASGSGHHYWVVNVTNAHTLASVSSSASSLASGSSTANSSSNEPLYRTVAYIQFDYAPFGGSIMQAIL